MTAVTYQVDRIVDLLKVPSDRRADCVRELLYGLELAEFAGAELLGPVTWTDDGDMSDTLHDDDGKTILKLQVTE